MEAVIKRFDQLTTTELYELLRLRAAVFVVEQGGRYLDPDGEDYRSIHIFFPDENGGIAGCVRVFPKDDEPGTACLGRVVVRDRMAGLGRRLIDEAARVAREEFGARQLYLTGRKSALGFYLRCGFYEDSPELHAQDVAYYILRKDI